MTEFGVKMLQHLVNMSLAYGYIIPNNLVELIVNNIETFKNSNSWLLFDANVAQPILEYLSKDQNVQNLTVCDIDTETNALIKLCVTPLSAIPKEQLAQITTKQLLFHLQKTLLFTHWEESDDESLTTLLSGKSPEDVKMLESEIQNLVPAKSEWFSSMLDYLIPEITGRQRPSTRPVLQQVPPSSEQPSTEQSNLSETDESNSEEESGKTSSQGDDYEAVLLVLLLIIVLAIAAIVIYFVRRRKARQNH